MLLIYGELLGYILKNLDTGRNGKEQEVYLVLSLQMSELTSFENDQEREEIRGELLENHHTARDFESDVTIDVNLAVSLAKSYHKQLKTCWRNIHTVTFCQLLPYVENLSLGF